MPTQWIPRFSGVKCMELTMNSFFILGQQKVCVAVESALCSPFVESNRGFSEVIPAAQPPNQPTAGFPMVFPLLEQ